MLTLLVISSTSDLDRLIIAGVQIADCLIDCRMLFDISAMFDL